MVCHPYADRVECHDGKKKDVIKPSVEGSSDRIAFLGALHHQLSEYFSKKNPHDVVIEYVNLGQGKKTVIRHVGEVTGVVVSAAIQAGAATEKV